MEPEESKDAVVFKRSVQLLQWGAQAVLLASFGGILGLMLFAGIDSLRALRQVQSRNVQIRQTFLLRDRALEEIRSAIYQSGTFTRDYLLERDASRAETYRTSLQKVRVEMDAALERYSRSLDAGEESSFQAMQARIADYWKLLDPSSIGMRRRSWSATTLSCTRNYSRSAPLRWKSPIASPRSTSRNSTTATSG
jgi:hypothetical protein